MAVSEESVRTALDQYYEIALPRPLRRQFTYKFQPTEELSSLLPGMVVAVPFGKSSLKGVVTSAAASPDPKWAGKVKPVTSVESQVSLVSRPLMELTRWISDYYLCSWGEALANAVPNFSKPVDDIEPVPSLPMTGHWTKTLTSEQEKALEALTAQGAGQNPFLLHGVTGSGKTEIYLRLAEKVLSEGRSVIYLVPEIAILDQIRLFAEEAFPGQVALFHSRQKPKEHRETWLQLKRGEKRFVLGPRSALFAPLENVGLIVLDEEHDDSYKQDETPRYHARLVAWKRAELEKSLLVMGSATPSLEILEAVKEGKVERIRLEKRVLTATLPLIRLIDMKREKRSSLSYITESLSEKIRDRLEKKEGVLLFLNRRGFSTQVRCRSCGYFSLCPHCDVALTFHQSERRLVCHYCNYGIAPASQCPECTKPLQYSGFGTERVESELARMFPGARIERLDKDTTQKRGSLEDVFQRFRDRKIDILVGTQMLSKGLDFKHLTLVGVISADGNLQLPDFRAAERTYQLLEQVSGRSGRGEISGEVILQTFLSDHHSIRAVVDRNTDRYIDKELEHRRRWQYPPFAQVINLTVRGRLEKPVIQATENLKKSLAALVPDGDGSTEILGPASLPFYRLRGYFRWHFMVKGKDLSGFKKQLGDLLDSNKLPFGLYLEVDVDPSQIL